MVNLIHPDKGYPFNARYKPFQQKELDFIRDNKDKYTITEIAKMLGFTNTTVFKYANHFGLRSTVRKPRTKQQVDKERVAGVLEHFANNYNLVEAGKSVGISITAASSIVTNHWMFKKESESTKVIVLKSRL